MDASPSLSLLLESVGHGDAAALDALVTSLYDELRRLARQHRQRWHGNYTLDSTALVHEAYLKLARQQRIQTSSRAHFLALASRAMRHVLSNYAEHRRTRKRGGGHDPVQLQERQLPADGAAFGEDEAVVAFESLHRALEDLEAVHARACRVVECRFFGGMSVEDTAIALRISMRTVKRDWVYAQAWLLRALAGTAAR